MVKPSGGLRPGKKPPERPDKAPPPVRKKQDQVGHRCTCGNFTIFDVFEEVDGQPMVPQYTCGKCDKPWSRGELSRYGHWGDLLEEILATDLNEGNCNFTYLLIKRLFAGLRADEGLTDQDILEGAGIAADLRQLSELRLDLLGVLNQYEKTGD